MRRVLFVFGTRPEAIKMCPVILEAKRRTSIDARVCITGQHREMLQSVLEVFGVVPNYNLAIMRTRQTLFDVTCSVLQGMKGVLERERPNIVLVHGDTTTSYAAALASFYMGIPVGHVEAGLRTYDNQSPFPEEFNRESVGIVADMHFAPTDLARANLLSEHRAPETIFVTGNTAIDALRMTVRADYSHPELEWACDSKIVLITAHRRENLGVPMHRMFRAIRRIVEEHGDVKAIYPIHMNPVVRRAAEEELSGCSRIRIIEPLDVFDFHNFLARAHLVLTDSGGIQEEAPSLGKPVLVMRDTTERPEGVSAGTLKLVGTEEDTIYGAFKDLLENESSYAAMSRASNPYGDGHASERIVDALENAESRLG